ncbi:hypothetical protein VMCG_06976 [Cytospora schulzeri]|uniref:F-box domain-containing protein n=1 Tax=Cytospora schulzeri TaxID=448051 RepID=A0A423W3X3_9PEZI|nr:hypothetical protein VMCG_06976 [Valsa malicola]
MSVLCLDYLPTEILQHVAQYLHDTHITSLASFSLVNKTCYASAKVWLFRSIRLQVTVTDPAQLNQEAVKWTKILQRTQSQRHVCQLSIVPRGGSEQARNDKSHSWLDQTWQSIDHEQQQSPRYEGNEPFKPIEEEEDRAWLPVAGLIKLVSYLKDLVYEPDYTLPPCLLRVLHEQHPQCRLHIFWFRFKSLHEPTVDPHELAIARSPCLHKITVRYFSWEDTRPKEDWNLDAHIRVVAGMAPNLREVRSLFCKSKHCSFLIRSNRMRKPWPGFSPDIDLPSSPGALECLSLFDAQSTVHDVGLDRWNEATDFSRLRVLDLCRATGQMLSWAAKNASLPNLKELRLHHHHPKPAFGSSSAFLSMIPPLEKLDYAGDVEEVLDSILDKHGPSLLKLSLDDHFDGLDVPTVQELQEKCPRLESLCICTTRSLSDETEVSMYRALGKMRHLTELSLELACSDFAAASQRVLTQSQREGLSPAPYEEFDGAFENTTWQAHPRFNHVHVRNTILNWAVDEALARSIWETIDESKAGDGKRLQSLKLLPTAFRTFLSRSGDFVEILECVSRSYSLERSVRDDDEGGVTIRELGRRAREAKCEGRHVLEQPGGNPTDSPVLEIIRHIWPRNEGSTSWHDDWRSLPLLK